jgi:hypothetical protein
VSCPTVTITMREYCAASRDTFGVVPVRATDRTGRSAEPQAGAVNRSTAPRDAAGPGARSRASTTQSATGRTGSGAAQRSHLLDLQCAIGNRAVALLLRLGSPISSGAPGSLLRTAALAQRMQQETQSTEPPEKPTGRQTRAQARQPTIAVDPDWLPTEQGKQYRQRQGPKHEKISQAQQNRPGGQVTTTKKRQKATATKKPKKRPNQEFTELFEERSGFIRYLAGSAPDSEQDRDGLVDRLLEPARAFSEQRAAVQDSLKRGDLETNIGTLNGLLNKADEQVGYYIKLKQGPDSVDFCRERINDAAEEKGIVKTSGPGSNTVWEYWKDSAKSLMTEAQVLGRTAASLCLEGGAEGAYAGSEEKLKQLENSGHEIIARAWERRSDGLEPAQPEQPAAGRAVGSRSWWLAQLGLAPPTGQDYRLVPLGTVDGTPIHFRCDRLSLRPDEALQAADAVAAGDMLFGRMRRPVLEAHVTWEAGTQAELNPHLYWNGLFRCPAYLQNRAEAIQAGLQHALEQWKEELQPLVEQALHEGNRQEADEGA